MITCKESNLIGHCRHLITKSLKAEMPGRIEKMPPSQTYPYPDGEGISESGPRWNQRPPLNLRFNKLSNTPPLLALGLVSIGRFEKGSHHLDLNIQAALLGSQH